MSRQPEEGSVALPHGKTTIARSYLAPPAPKSNLRRKRGLKHVSVPIDKEEIARHRNTFSTQNMGSNDQTEKRVILDNSPNKIGEKIYYARKSQIDFARDKGTGHQQASSPYIKMRESKQKRPTSASVSTIGQEERTWARSDNNQRADTTLSNDKAYPNEYQSSGQKSTFIDSKKTFSHKNSMPSASNKAWAYSSVSHLLAAQQHHASLNLTSDADQLLDQLERQREQIELQISIIKQQHTSKTGGTVLDASSYKNNEGLNGTGKFGSGGSMTEQRPHEADSAGLKHIANMRDEVKVYASDKLQGTLGSKRSKNR